MSQFPAILVQSVFFFVHVMSFVLNRIPIRVDLGLIFRRILRIVSHVVFERTDVLAILLNRLLILANVMAILTDVLTILSKLTLANRGLSDRRTDTSWRAR